MQTLTITARADAQANSVVGTLPKNAREELRVSLEEFNGHKLLNLRVWYRRDDEEMRPGKQGLAVRIEKAAELRDMFDKAIDMAERAMSAATIARALGGKRCAGGFIAKCPTHEDGSPSLSIRDGDYGLLVKCFAGCTPADVLRELRRRGLLGDETSRRRDILPAPRSAPAADVVLDMDTSRYTLGIWRETQPLPGTPGQAYLERERRVSYDGEALRWHPNCPFGKDRVGCMVGLVRNIKTNEPQGIHRTAIDGQGHKLSHLDGNGRLSLGPTRGGAIKLTNDPDVERVIAIGEGIESTLSIRHLPDLEPMPLWAVLNANGIESFPALPGIESVWIAADNDRSGTGQRAALALAQRLTAAGIEPVIIAPQAVGSDLNDKVAANV